MELSGYAQQILGLLPKGAAWQGEQLRALVSSFAGEVYRLATGAENVAIEAIPTTTDDLLADYERLVGLPYPGFDLAGSTDARRADVLSILLAQGGQSKSYFLSLITARGHVDPAIKDDFTPFVAGSLAGTPLYGEAWVFYWEVTFREGDPDDLLEFLLQRYKPAHTTVGFVYA